MGQQGWTPLRKMIEVEKKKNVEEIEKKICVSNLEL
jgi:hypothetical protein